MKYIVIEENRADTFVNEFETEAEAVAYADDKWERMTKGDKAHTDAFYVLESVNPDEEAENHFDGDYVKEYKEG